MPDRDFYEVLGLKRGATADEIKRAYRKLARQLHPDVNKAPDAAKRFAEVQEAYDVLSDEERRKQYDLFGRAGVGGAAGRAGAASGPHGAGSWPGGVRFETEMGDLGDLGDLGSVFDAFFGRSASGPTRSARAHRAARKGRDVRGQIEVDLETVALGGRRSLRVREGDRERTIEVTIPAGVSSGQTLRMRGEGEPGPGGERGDLLVEVRVRDHPLFRRGQPGKPSDSSLDLFFDLPLTIWEAMHGAHVDVPTLEGTVQLTIPGGTSSGKSLRLKARGLPGRSGERGDLYAVVQIVVPKADVLSGAEQRAIENVARRGPKVRSGSPWTR
ncbi:MAG: DnaJ domain-containing protein [Phycisphaerales bacterium]|nr:DnaJ domain-containing protein [Phycisphaerales bacterium]